MFPGFYIQAYCVVIFACCFLNKKTLTWKRSRRRRRVACRAVTQWTTRVRNFSHTMIRASHNETRVSVTFLIQMRGGTFHYATCRHLAFPEIFKYKLLNGFIIAAISGTWICPMIWSVAYPGILFVVGFQQIQLRTERTEIWGW